MGFGTNNFGYCLQAEAGEWANYSVNVLVPGLYGEHAGLVAPIGDGAVGPIGILSRQSRNACLRTTQMPEQLIKRDSPGCVHVCSRSTILRCSSNLRQLQVHRWMASRLVF